MTISTKIQTLDTIPTRNVFISAIRFAMSIDGDYPPFGDELRTSAQEQMEYMLEADKDIQLVTSDVEVTSVVKLGLSVMFSSFEDKLSSFVSEPNILFESAKESVLQVQSDIEWMCNVLSKMELMKDLVSNWIDISSKVLNIMESKKFDSRLWGLKVKLVEVTGKVLEVIGYGSVILSARLRVHLLKTWLLFVRKLKPLVEAEGTKNSGFPYKMDDDLCQYIEGALVSLVLALPSDDQADVLGEWMRAMEKEHAKFSDFSEAFEVWCYRSKSAKRRLLERCDRLANANASLGL